MINFFRKIRQKLLTEHKFSKYLTYAFGEIILVVIGILIALQINNWNELRKLENKKQELIINLLDDFEESNKELKIAIEYSDTLTYQMNTFFNNAYSTELKIPVDSLKVLSDGFFRPVDFYISMVTYAEAKANGNLSLLKSKELFTYFAAFEKTHLDYINIQNEKRESFFKGPVWELKKTIGSIYVFIGRQQPYIKKIDDESYLELINSPLATSVFENEFILNKNTNGHLKYLNTLTKEIIKKLNEMKK